ncbi:MAG: hypothetical protein JSU76_01025 [Dehalococcoidia bacterium]|nr:MAG: hypothetical protein JSU76_01025 [Dehalococcoidia bacterium]
MGRNLKKLTLFVLSLSLVAGILLMGGCVGKEIEAPPQETPTQIVDRILAEEAFALMQEIPDHQLIDLRTPEEFANEHLPGAINIYILSESFLDEIDKLDKNKITLAYYRPYGLPMPMGWPRPNETMSLTIDAHALFKELGFREAYIIKGGAIAWKFEGLPTIKGTGAEVKTTREAVYVDSITAKEAFALMQEKSEYVIIDTRTPKEFANEHLPDAINIDYESGDFRDKLNKLDKQKTYFFYYKPYGICTFQYCATSEALTATLDMIQTFKELTFREAHFIEGGVIAWKVEVLPTEK